MNTKFTDRYLQSLKPAEKEYCVREGHGFTIRVWTSGVKTFQYIYTIAGKRRRMALGNYPHVSLKAAREKYGDAYKLVSNGIDPQATVETPPAPAEPEATTISDLVKKYSSHIEINLVERSAKLQKQRLEKHLVPVWGERDVTTIRRRQAIELIENLAAKKPGAARNVLLSARAMFTYALRREMVEFNPFSEVGLAVPAATPNDRDRTLPDEELKNTVLPYLLSPVGNTLIKNALLLILCTGQRPGEVVGLHSKEVDEDWWTIPWQRIKTECRKGKKNPQDHRVYLTPLAKSFLPSADKNGIYFPAGRKAKGPIKTNSLAHHIQFTEPNYLGLPRWTPHDLRRTARTGMAALKVPERHAEAVLNHKQERMKKIYDRHLYDGEKKAALNKWSKHLEVLIREVKEATQKTEPERA